jgi:predicted MPP superfamily phosphohydrolase
MPPLSTHDVVSERIHPGLDGVRIGHLSDIHVRTGVKPRRLEQAVDQLNEAAPDFVVLTGDYVCFSPRPLPALTSALRRLRVPAFATLGNHDHWSGADQVRRALSRAGIQVLTNEHRMLSVRGEALHLVGLDDPVTRKSDPVRAFHGLPASGTRIVLSHCPAFADRLTDFSPALILSGHTHGGQLFIKKVTPYVSARLGMKYLAGFFDVEGAVLYVSRGLGASVPVRFRAPSEVSLLTLRSAARALLPASASAVAVAA